MSENEIYNLMQKAENLADIDGNISPNAFADEMQRLTETLGKMLKTCSNFECEIAK